MLIVGLGAIGACRGSPSPIHWCPNTANSVLVRYEPVVFLLQILTGTDPLLYLGVCLQGQSVSAHWCPNTTGRVLVGLSFANFFCKILTSTDPLLYLGMCLQGGCIF